MAYGRYTDPGAKNRDLSRPGDLRPDGTEIPENLLKSSDYRKKELEDIIKIRRSEKEPAATWNRYYWWSSYFAHQRKHYYSSVRMHSSRQKNVEEPYNEEGLKMHHLADGSNFITRTGNEYVDIFPVWDWQKIPGATIVQKPELPHWKEIARKGLSPFVGAVTDGDFGAAAFDFKSVHDPLTARKAWFFFDKEYVCLGNSIKSEAEYPVATTLNQCLLNKDVIVKTKSGPQKLTKGKHHLTNVSWVMHDSVGYLFLSPSSVNLNNTTVTGNWRSITHQARATTEPVQNDVFSLWIDHGKKPTAANYAYIVVPGTTASFLDQYGKKNSINILSNSAEVQAVQNKDLNISQIIFYQAGTIQLSNKISLTANSPCIVMVKVNNNSVEKISVADPTAKLSSLQLSLNVPVEGKGDDWQANWDKEKKSTSIQINLPSKEYAGKSVVLELKKA
jgi:chondroitin AC lyase